MQVPVIESYIGEVVIDEEPSVAAPICQRTLSAAILQAHNNSTSAEDVSGNVAPIHEMPVAMVVSSDDFEKYSQLDIMHDTRHMISTEIAASKTPGSLRVISSSSGHHEVCNDYQSLSASVCDVPGTVRSIKTVRVKDLLQLHVVVVTMFPF
jgi:hypothetical protein